MSHTQRKQSSNERLFLEGWCHHFATALHEKFGYQIRVFYTEPREDSWQYQLIPFHVVGDKSPTEMYDVRGQVSTSDVEDLLEADMEMIDHELYSNPARFYQEWTGTGEPLLEYDEQVEGEAKEIIEKNPEKYGQEEVNPPASIERHAQPHKAPATEAAHRASQTSGSKTKMTKDNEKWDRDKCECEYINSLLPPEKVLKAIL